MTAKLTIKQWVIFCLVSLMISAASPLFAEQENGPAMMEGCQAMMERHQEMKAANAEAATRLHDLMEALDAAKGQEQVVALVATAREIAEQLDSMRGRMMGMDSREQMHMMMAHMREKSGDMGECQMMQAMMAQDNGPDDSKGGGVSEGEETDEHEGHH